MAKINFYIRSKQEGQPATVYLRFSDIRGVDIWTPTPEKIFPEFWSNKTQSFKQRIFFNEIFSEKDKNTIEERFTKLKENVLKELLNLKGKPITKDWLKLVINKCYDKKTPGDETLNQFVKRFIEEISSGKRLYKGGKRYVFLTIKNYKGFEVQFLEYQGIYSEDRLKELTEKNEPPRPVKILNFEDITIDFYNKFLHFLNDKNYSSNTIGRHIKHLKVIMRQSKNEGLHNNMEFQNESFMSMAEKVDNIYLTETEMKKIFDLNLSDNKPLELIRDVFLCGCYTAQRFSDYSRIRKSNIRNIEGRNVIDMIQQKTGERVVIPIRNELDIILKKYDYNLPKTFEQKVNEKIKDIGEMAGITEIIHYEENRGGFRVPKNLMKCDLIKTHTARRSGCTNIYLAKIQPIDIMKISGHKTEREFLKYIKIGKDETAVLLADHPYFIGNTLSVAK
ncbi:MAG: phage integrase SAM-like domain-containing protein [Bacteroidota bacterium]